MATPLRRGAVAALLAVPVLAAAQSPSPSPRLPVFKSEVNYVEVDVLVTDKDGHTVRDLRPEEFQVLEDGKPQAVAAFVLSSRNIPS